MRNVKGKFQSCIVGGKKVKKKRLRGSRVSTGFSFVGSWGETFRSLASMRELTLFLWWCTYTCKGGFGINLSRVFESPDRNLHGEKSLR